MNGYFKQVTPPKAPSNSKRKEHSLNKISEFKKNGCKMFVIEYDPIDNQRMGPVWALFIDSGEMYSRNQGETASNPTPRGEGSKLH
jgi:hypothetical protein